MSVVIVTAGAAREWDVCMEGAVCSGDAFASCVDVEAEREGDEDAVGIVVAESVVVVDGAIDNERVGVI